MLSREEACHFYDRLGSRQDSQAYYEDPATREMIRHAEFGAAGSVLEFGCGTGRFARELLEHHLAADCRYLGIDSSSTMVGLARRRLEAWEHVEIQLSDGSPKLPAATRTVDRVVSNYVLDILSEEDIGLFLNEAARVLRPRGKLCLVSLTWGETPAAKVVSRLWAAVHRRKPAWVGGCRPLELLDYLPQPWRIEHREVVTSWAISSEVLVASQE